MGLDVKKFSSLLPHSFIPILEELLLLGFRPTLVGGVVRDFLLTSTIGEDWDIELFHENLVFEKSSWKDLGKRLSRFGRVQYLPYEIIRLELGPLHLEFSPPRVEHFLSQVVGHSNFEAEYLFNLPFPKAVLRRDFTINALALRFHSQKEIFFLDPLEGESHLKAGELHPCGNNFKLDPVRFLRAHRFKIKYGFSFSSDLQQILKTMELGKLSSTHFLNEMQKSLDPLEFIKSLFQSQNPSLELPLDHLFLKNFSQLKDFIPKPLNLESWTLGLLWVGIPVENWSRYFSLSADLVKKLTRWVKTTQDFSLVYPEEFQHEFDLVKDSENFLKLFDWYFTTKNLLQKNSSLPLISLVESHLSHWTHLFRFEIPTQVKHIDPPYRAKYQVWNLCQRL